MSEGDLNVGDKPDSNLDCLLGDHSALRLQWVDYSTAISDELWLVERILMCSQLDDLVLEDCITHFMTRNFTETINRCNFFVLNVKVDLDVTAIDLLCHSCVLRASDYLKSVAHVRSDEQVVREDLQQREHFDTDHLGHDLIASITIGAASVRGCRGQ